MRPNSIRARMTLGFAFFIALLMLLVCAAFYFYTKHADRKSADILLSQAAREVRQDMQDDENDTSREQNANQVPDVVKETSDNPHSHDLAIIVVDKRGRIIAHTREPFPTWPLRGDSWRATIVQGRAYDVVLAFPWYKNERALRERTLFLLALSVLVVAASSGGAWVLVGRTLSPIDALARQAQAASVEHLFVQLQASSPDVEIARLVSTLNDLLARWSETAQSRERFYAAAAHELRTPLQALGGHLEVALSRPRNAEEYQNALRESHTQTERLTSLVQDLLLLNQLDADTARPSCVSLDLADVCESELRPLRNLAEERALKIELDLPEHCEIEAPWNHVTMLLRNLLENAVKYAPRGGIVRVQLQQTTLTICNDCAFESEMETEKLFEPFFRPDASRTSSTGGNGLGLAICRAICQNNHWTIDLRTEAKTLCAIVVFTSRHVGNGR